MRISLIVDEPTNRSTMRLVPENETEKDDLRKLNDILTKRRLLKPRVRPPLYSSEGDIILSIY